MTDMLVPLWVEIVVSALLVISGVFALVGGMGLLRLKGFMLRMHAPALGFTLGSWSVTLALVTYFTALEGSLATDSFLIVILLALTTPVTTLLLARAALFRHRQAGNDVPPALTATKAVKAAEKSAADEVAVNAATKGKP
ncbi:hypothetical protein BH09PSE5_BH09PSE5_50930 [soil metagenome]